MHLPIQDRPADSERAAAPYLSTLGMSSTAGGLSVLGRSPPGPRCCPAPARRSVNARYVSHDAGDRLGFATFESCQAPVSERFPTSRDDRGGSCKSLTRKNDHHRDEMVFNSGVAEALLPPIRR